MSRADADLTVVVLLLLVLAVAWLITTLIETWREVFRRNRTLSPEYLVNWVAIVAVYTLFLVWASGGF